MIYEYAGDPESDAPMDARLVGERMGSKYTGDRVGSKYRSPDLAQCMCGRPDGVYDCYACCYSDGLMCSLCRELHNMQMHLWRDLDYVPERCCNNDELRERERNNAIVNWMQDAQANGLPIRTIGEAVYAHLKYGDALSATPVHRDESRMAFPFGPFSVKDTLRACLNKHVTLECVRSLQAQGYTMCSAIGCTLIAPGRSGVLHLCSCKEALCEKHAPPKHCCTFAGCVETLCAHSVNADHWQECKRLKWRCLCGAFCCATEMHDNGWQQSDLGMRCPSCACSNPLPALAALSV